MISLLNQFPGFVLCVTFVMLCSATSCLGLHLFQKWISPQSLKPIHDVVGYIFGAASLIYSLVLAFVIVAVWDDYEAINSDVDGETNKLENIFVHAQQLPDSLRLPVLSLVTNYSKEVVDNWHSGKSSLADRDPSMITLRSSLFHFHSSNLNDEQTLEFINDELTDAAEFRRDRSTRVHSHVPELVWTVLLVGSVITILFSFFFCVEPPRRHYFFVILLTVMISLSLFLVFVLDHPFDGTSEVSPQPFIDLYSGDIQ